MNAPTAHRRRRKLILPGLQLRLVGSFVGLAALGMLLQFLLLGQRLTAATAALEGPGGELGQELPGMLLDVLVYTCGVLVPLIFGFGIFLTFRVAGPIYRFEQYLDGVARGEQLGPCKLREGDHLQALCDAINRATEPLRRRTLGTTPAADDAVEAGAEALRRVS
jgi:hypothetical protein